MKLLLASALLLTVMQSHAQDTSRLITFTRVEVEAEYPGGAKGWNSFLAKNLHYPDDAVNNEISGTVVVQFIVDADGNISDIHPVSGPTKGGLREEAVRVVGLSGKWTPATQNGHKVRSYKKVPLQFKMSFG